MCLLLLSEILKYVARFSCPEQANDCNWGGLKYRIGIDPSMDFISMFCMV